MVSETSTSATAAHFSEARQPDGTLRPHWRTLAGLLDGARPESMAALRENIRRHLAELGATYSIYADAQGQERPWQLDVFPLMIPATEWSGLEAGLQQRTLLLNAILRDLYGPQRLLREGLLPPELVFGHPAFLRPCMGLAAPRDMPLVLHAVNLARLPDGRWRVLSDRTQCPSGLGYALANRIALSRALPDAFRQAQVQRQASFFMAFRETLAALAPAGSETPALALLTPGPFNETFFEHTFLARYLGFPLVEGGDLTLRDGRVFIRTLEGPRPVDVLLRRVDDAWCDPLELRADSMLGVPGLLDAARHGRIALVNSLGSAWLETPALAAFLPRLCRHLLGEELRLPGLDTWWCGDDEARHHVGEHLDTLTLKHIAGPAFASHRFGHRLDDAGRAKLRELLAFDPSSYAAQEHASLSQAPTLLGGEIEARSVVFRAFVLATPQGCHVLPGGLTRVTTAADRLIVSMQSGGMSKDTWVMSDGPVANVSLLRPATQVIRLERAPAEVPSRVADNLFWLGRYAERLEDTARILRSVLNRLANETGAEETSELAALVPLLVKLDFFPERFLTQRTLAGIERETVQLIFHTHRLGTVREVHGRLQALAFSLRDRFSADTQRILQHLHEGLRPPDPAQSPSAGAIEVLDHIILHLAALSGMEMENMTRGHGWRFLDLGRRLERAVNSVTLLHSALLTRPPEPSAMLAPILEIADSSMTYRRRYFGQPAWPTVVDLLLADDTNPRSFVFQTNAIFNHVQRLPGQQRTEGDHDENRPLLALRKTLTQINLAELTEGDGSPESDPLPGTLHSLADSVRQLSDTLTRRYFAHTQARAH